MSQTQYKDLIKATSGLQSYWMLDESSGNVADSQGSVTGTANGSLTYSGTGTSYIGPGISAPGSGADYIDFGANYSFSGTASHTIEAWIRPGASSIGGRIIARERYLTTYAGWAFCVNAGQLYYFRCVGDGTNAYYKDWQATTTTLASGTWYHIAVTYSSGNQTRLYVNGVLESATKGGTSDVSYPSPYSVGTTSVGNLRAFIPSDNTASSRLNARLMHLAVYNTELSAATLLDHYRTGVGTNSTLFPTAHAATASLPAPVVTATSPSVTVTSPPLAATASLPAPVVSAGSAYNTIVTGTSGLQSYWKLGEASGTTIADSYGSVTGTAGSAVTLGATGLVPSDSGKACSFVDDTTNAVIDLGNNYKFSGTTAFSVEAWVRSTNLAPVDGSNHIIGAFDGTKGWRLVAGNVFGQNRFYFARYDSGGSSDDVRGGTAITTNTTYHVVVTYDGTNLKLYVNGALDVAATTSTRSITASSTNLKIGSPKPGYGSMIGTLDDISIYNTALSASTVANHYAGSITASTTSPALSASVALPMPGTGLAADAIVTVDAVASATASLSTPSIVAVGASNSDSCQGSILIAGATTTSHEYIDSSAAVTSLSGLVAESHERDVSCSGLALVSGSAQESHSQVSSPAYDDQPHGQWLASGSTVSDWAHSCSLTGSIAVSGTIHDAFNNGLGTPEPITISTIYQTGSERLLYFDGALVVADETILTLGR